MANKTIQQLDPLTTADASDLLALYDVSGNGTNSITAANLLNTTTISGLETTAKTIPAAINELNTNLNNIYAIREIILTQQTIASQNAGTWNYKLSSSDIPNGYNKIFVLIPSTSGSYNCYFYNCYAW